MASDDLEQKVKWLEEQVAKLDAKTKTDRETLDDLLKRVEKLEEQPPAEYRPL